MTKLQIIKKNSIIPLLIMGLLAMFMLPLPPILIDFLFTLNIVLSILILLRAIGAKKPLEFSSFPTVLLIATLMRLALNVASTRLVLLEGHNGPDAAGQVIQSFGEVVIGGNYTVGLAIFLILLIVNFVVITKGGGRVSEVQARFTLDGMPGKQMAVDAELNAGSLTSEESTAQRKEISREADFAGSMDGASKFVRGDAIAGLLILAVNLIGGFLIGVLQHGMSSSEALQVFSLLTIGDGLVAQIPSLLLATAAAILVTRVKDEADGEMSEQMRSQLLANPTVLTTASALMFVMGVVPGMPTLAFLSFSGVLGLAAWVESKRKLPEDQELDEVQDEELNRFIMSEPALTWEDVPEPDRLRIELGYRLVPLAEQTNKQPLPSIFRGTRKKLMEQFGFLIPEIMIRDNLNISPIQYLIKIDDIEVATGMVNPDKLVAVETTDVRRKIDGEIIREPAFNLPAVLIEPNQRSKALNNGYSVADASTIISFHLGRTLREHAHEIFSHDEVIGLTKRLEELSKPLHDSLTAALTPVQLLGVFRKLLQEQVSISDIKTIATALVQHAERTKDPVLLTSEVRYALRRSILVNVNGSGQEVNVWTLSDNLVQMLNGSYNQAQSSGRQNLENLPIDPNVQAQIEMALPQVVSDMRAMNLAPILLVPVQLRPQLAKLARIRAPELTVLSFLEIPEEYTVNTVNTMG